MVEAKNNSLLSLNLILTLNGFEVVSCRDLDEALAKEVDLEAASKPCEFLVTDIPASKLTDSEFFRRRLLPGSTFPVYLISNYIEKNILNELERGGCRVMEMPVDSQEFFNIVKKNEIVKVHRRPK